MAAAFVLKKPKTARELKAELVALFAEGLEDGELRERLEALAREPAFDGLTCYWGPILYRRTRVVFRPFILAHFATWGLVKAGKWEAVRWQGPHQRDLEAWLAAVDEADDIQLFRRLYQWKLTPPRKWQIDRQQWQNELVARYRAAEQRHERQTVLAKLDLPAVLDEPAAVDLYRRDADAARPFILKHLPTGWFAWGEKRTLWRELAGAAKEQGDEDFYFSLYRRQIPLKEWQTEALGLCRTVGDSEQLVAELQKRHPEGWDLDLGKPFFELVQVRGRDVLPYVIRHLRRVWRGWLRTGYDKMLKLARDKGWLDFWSALVRVCALPKEYNQEVALLLANRKLPDREVERRLLLLTGVSREWNFGPVGLAQVQLLTDAVAVGLYERFPHLLLGPFKMHVSASYGETYPTLTGKALARDDEPLIDYLGSRVVPRANQWGYEKDLIKLAETLADHYEALLADPAEFCRRAVAVLGQVPPYWIWNYNALVRNNRLARLLYERSSSAYLVDPVAFRDLIEAPSIQAQALAYRALGLDDDRARTLAAENLDLLLGTLLRPLHRKTRALAFGALLNAAIDLDRARRIHDRARQALDLPDKRYPKEQLVGLIGKLLWRWPELRSPREQPLVYQGAAP